MSKPAVLLTFVIALLPSIAAADVASEDLPGDIVWYFHVDLEQMRGSDAGSKLYGWFEDEVDRELGIDVDREVDRITAFSADGDDYVAIVAGRLSEEARERVLQLDDVRGHVEPLEHAGMTYYRGSGTRRKAGERVSGYFSFALPGKLVASSSENTLKTLLDNGGRVSGLGSGGNALFVLSADRQFVQAGMRTAEIADHDGGWSSNILRNTEQAAMLVTEAGGLLAVQAKLVSKDAEMTRSLGSIVNGVIALQAFSADMDPRIAEVLRNTKVEIEGAVLAVSTAVDPAVFLKSLGE